MGPAGGGLAGAPSGAAVSGADSGAAPSVGSGSGSAGGGPAGAPSGAAVSGADSGAAPSAGSGGGSAGGGMAGAPSGAAVSGAAGAPSGAGRLGRRFRRGGLSGLFFAPRLGHGLGLARLLGALAGAALGHRLVERGLVAQAERNRVLLADVGEVPVRAVANRADRRFGRAHQTRDLRVRELGMEAQQPSDRVGPVLALGNRGVARPRGAARRQLDPGDGELEWALGVGLGGLDAGACELAARDRVDPPDADRDLIIGDAGHLERMQPAERGDLIERQGGALDQPYGGRLGHEGQRHSSSAGPSRPAVI